MTLLPGFLFYLSPGMCVSSLSFFTPSDRKKRDHKKEADDPYVFALEPGACLTCTMEHQFSKQYSNCAKINQMKQSCFQQQEQKELKQQQQEQEDRLAKVGV